MIRGFQGLRLSLVLGLIGIIASGCDDMLDGLGRLAALAASQEKRKCP